MRSTETPSQAFFNNHENTMGRKVCSSTFSALMILEKNHTMPKDLGSQNALEENLSAFIKDLITHGFLPENKEEVIDSSEAEIEVGANSGTESEDTTYVDSEDENQAEIKKTPAQQFQESVLAKALEPINAHDRGVVYNPTSKQYDPVEFSLCKVLTILLVALQDEQGEKRRYWKSPYLVRLKKFYDILNPQVKCHTGFRNDWVKGLLHEEYDNMYFMEELGQTLENIASDFFKERLLKIEEEDPKRFYKILFQWIDVRNQERPIFDAFIDSLTNELQAFLERALLAMGLDPKDEMLESGKAWEKSIAESLKLRIDCAQSLACPHLPGFEKVKKILSEFIEKKKSFPPVLLAKFRSCETVKDLEDRALDVHRDFIYLRERAQHYNFVFPLGKEGGELVAYVRVLIPSLDKLLENPETNWGAYRDTLKTCESQLEHFIENNRKANNHFEYFRNSFALAKNMKSPEDIYQLYHHVKTLFEDHCLRVTDEMIDKWFENSKQSPGFFDLQQHDLNRICWQALFLSPLNWSEKFTRNLFEGILHQLENPINPDSLHDNILKSFPEALVKQLKHRLSLRKIPLMISEAEHFFPGNLDGITLIQNPHELIEKLQDPTCDRVALIEHLHFPAYFFKPNMQAKDSSLEKVLALLPKEKGPALLPRLLNFGDSQLLVSLESFLRVLEEAFPEEERWPFIQKSLENPNSKTKTHFLSNPRLRVAFYRESFDKFFCLISRPHRIHLLKKLIEIGTDFAGRPLDLKLLREILCQLPEKDWPEFFAVLPHPTRLDDFAPSFIDFLPEHLLPNFFKWYMTDNLSPTWDIVTIFNQSRDGKCLPILKAIFELDEKILEKIVSYCIKDFFDVLPRLESKDRAEYLHLLALTLSKLNEIPPSNFECLSKLSEEETIEFIGFFKDPSALQLLPSLPKSCWASFCEQIGFTEKVARNDLSDFWPYLRKFEDKKAVVDFFKIDIAKNLQSPENFIFATAQTPVSDMDKIPKLSNQEGKWIDIFDSYDKLYEIFSCVFRLDEDLNHLERELVSCEESEEGYFRLLSSCDNPSALPDGLTRAKSRCHDLLAHLSPDLKQVIKTKDQLLGIVVVISSCGPHLDRFIKAWEDHFKNPMPDALSKGLSSFFEKHLDFLDNIFSSFEDYQNFFSELQQLNLSKEALFNFLRAPFLKKSRDPEQYEKMFASFQEVDGNIGRDCYLNSLIPWPELDSENFLLTIYPYFNENTWPEGLFRILVKNCDILDMAILARQYFMLWENIGFNPSQVEMHWLRLCDWLEVREILHLFRVICAQDPKRKFNLSEEQKLNLFKAIVNTEKFKRDEGLQQRNLFEIVLATGSENFFLKQLGELIQSFDDLIDFLRLLKKKGHKIEPIFASLAKQEDFARLVPNTGSQAKILELLGFPLFYLRIFTGEKSFDSAIQSEFERICHHSGQNSEERALESAWVKIARHINHAIELKIFLGSGTLKTSEEKDTFLLTLPRYKLVQLANTVHYYNSPLPRWLPNTMWATRDFKGHWKIEDNSWLIKNSLPQNSSVTPIIETYSARLERIFPEFFFGDTYSEFYKRPTLFLLIIGFFETVISDKATFIIDEIRAIEERFKPTENEFSQTKEIDEALLKFLSNQLIEMEQGENYWAALPIRLHFIIYFLSHEQLRSKSSNCYYCEEELNPETDPIQNSNNGP